MKNKFNQIIQDIILKYEVKKVVKNTSLGKKCKLYQIVSLIMVYKCCIVNYRSNYTGEESTTVFSFPKEEDLKKRWIKFFNRKDCEPISLSYIYLSLRTKIL